MRAIPGLLLVPILVLAPSVASAATGELGFGRMLLQTVLSLGLVCLLAVVVLRLLARSGLGGLGTGRGDGSRMDVIERVGVGPRQALLAVRVLDRVVVVGQSPAGFARLAEVSFAQWQTGGRGFAAAIDEAPVSAAPPAGEPVASGEIVA